MTERQSQATAAARLQQVHERIEQWRSSRTKRSRIPQDIWQDATILGEKLGVYPVARALRLDYQGLRRRVDQRVSERICAGPTDLSSSVVPTWLALVRPRQ
jgi:hypothetical protein